MPNYYPNYGVPNWNGAFNAYGQPMQQPVYQSMQMSGVQQNPQYMIQVDGEMAARAWQAPNNLPPRTMIPLWDYDGQHIYFKSTDEYGRMNPMRKAIVLFEDEQKNLPQNGNSGSSEGVSGNQSIELPDMTKYITKDDFESFKEDLRSMFTAQANQRTMENMSGSSNNQNGNDNSGNNGNNRGGGRR